MKKLEEDKQTEDSKKQLLVEDVGAGTFLLVYRGLGLVIQFAGQDANCQQFHYRLTVVISSFSINSALKKFFLLFT